MMDGYTRFIRDVSVVWLLLYLLGAFLCAEWDVSFWSDWVRGSLALVAFLFAAGAYGTRNLEY